MKWSNYFYYSDGALYWKVKRTNRAPVSSRAGCLNKITGYRRVRLFGRCTMEHRIIWELHNGEIPEGMEIDHINHVRDDNRIENLRLVRRQQNNQNASRRKDNTSGVTGVSWCKTKKRWCASININGKKTSIGYYISKQQAVEARKMAENTIGFHKNHGAKNH